MFFISPNQSLQIFLKKEIFFFLLKWRNSKNVFQKFFFLFVFFSPFLCSHSYVLSPTHKNNKSSKYDTKLPECVSVSFCRCVWWLCVTFSIRRWFKRQEEKQTKCTRWENKKTKKNLITTFLLFLGTIIDRDILVAFLCGKCFPLFLNWCRK